MLKVSAKSVEERVVDSLGQIIWEARRAGWQGDVQSKPLKLVSESLKLLVGKLKAYVTRAVYQALYSVLCRSTTLAKQGLHTQGALLSAAYACRILAYLYGSGFKPSTVPEVSQYKGMTVSDTSLLAATVEGVKQGPKAFHELLFIRLWQLLVVQTEAGPKQTLKLMQQAMNSTDLKPWITLPGVLPVFIECVADAVVYLSRGDNGNWHDVVITLVTDSLKLQQQPDPRVVRIMQEAPSLPPKATHKWLGTLDFHRLTAFFVVLNNIHVFQKTVNENYGMFLTQPVPTNGVTERLFGTGSRTSLLRTCVVKSLITAGKAKKNKTVIHAGVLGTAAQHSNVFDQTAEAALRGAVKDFFMESEVDLGATGLSSDLEQRTSQIVHTLSCARTSPSLEEAQLPVGPKREKLVQDITSIFVGIILADEFLFGDRERKHMNLSFINSQHIKNHHAMLQPYKPGITKLLKSLKVSVSKDFVEALWYHAQAIDSLVGHCIFKAVQGKTREDKNVFSLLVNTFPDVLKLTSHSAPASDRPSGTEDPALPEISRMCVEIMGCYFPAVPYTSLPPLPVDKDNQNSPKFQEELRKAFARRANFRKLEQTLQRHIAVLNRTRPYTEKVIKNIFDEEARMKKGDRHAVYKLCYWLFCLRLAMPNPASLKRHSHLVPQLLRFVRREYPEMVLVAAHAVIVKLLKEPSVAAASAYPMYLNECIPMRPVPGGGKQLALHQGLLERQSMLLVRHFTMNIRAVCQKLEEWDIDLAAEDGGKVLPQGEHPSGVGLVLYTVEALKQVILKLSMRGAAHHQQTDVRKQRLYINALVNLLQCLNTDVLTHVCTSLETVFSSLSDIKEVTFWLGYTSKAIKGSENPSTKQQVVAWFLRLQSLLSPEKLGIRAKL